MDHKGVHLIGGISKSGISGRETRVRGLEAGDHHNHDDDQNHICHHNHNDEGKRHMEKEQGILNPRISLIPSLK